MAYIPAFTKARSRSVGIGLLRFRFAFVETHATHRHEHVAFPATVRFSAIAAAAPVRVDLLSAARAQYLIRDAVTCHRGTPSPSGAAWRRLQGGPLASASCPLLACRIETCQSEHDALVLLIGSPPPPARRGRVQG